RRAQEAPAGASRPLRDAGISEDVHGEERRGVYRRVLGKTEAERPAGVDRAAERHDRVDAAGAPEGGHLETEHAALRIATDVDPVVSGLVAGPVDRLVDREHVIVERALEPTLLLFGGAEVDDPGVDPVV